MKSNVSPCNDQIKQFGRLRIGQSGGFTRAFAGLQPFESSYVAAMHTFAKSLSIHAIQSNRIAAGPAIKHMGDRQHPANLRASACSSARV
jgi:hypothetical protein